MSPAIRRLIRVARATLPGRTVNGSLDLGENTTFPTLTVDGTLGGPLGHGDRSADARWGSLDGPGTVTVNSSGSLQVSGDYYSYIAGSLVNKGTGTIQANTLLSVEAGGSFDNAGSLQLNDDSYLYGDSGNASQESESGTTPAVPGGVFTNTGSITIDSASNYPATLGSGTGINNQGAITVSSGVLQSRGTRSRRTRLIPPRSGVTLDHRLRGHLDCGVGGRTRCDGRRDLRFGRRAQRHRLRHGHGSLDLGQNTTFPTLTGAGRSRGPLGHGHRIAVVDEE